MPHPSAHTPPFVAALAGLAAFGALAAPEVEPSPPDAEFPPQDVVLPTNARVIFSGPADLTGVTFARPGFDEELPFEVVPREFEGNRVLFIVTPGDLTGADLLVVEPRCPGCVSVSEAPSWTVGTAPDETPPAFSAVAAGEPQVITAGTVDVFGIHRASSHDVSATLPTVTDDSGFVHIRTDTDEAGFLDTEAVASGSAADARMSFPPGPVRTECFRATAIDIAGNEAELAAPICADVGEGGCAQTGPSSSAALAALLAVLSRSRRSMAPDRGSRLRARRCR